MDQNWRHLPPAARPIAAATTEAVDAAQRRDEEALTAAADDLGGLDPAQTGLVLGTLIRLLLEETHPDGLDGVGRRRRDRPVRRWEVPPVLLHAGTLAAAKLSEGAGRLCP